MAKLETAFAVLATCTGPCDDSTWQPGLNGVCPEVRIGTTINDIQLATDVRVSVFDAIVVDEQGLPDDYLVVTVVDARLGLLSVSAREAGTGYLKIAYKPHDVALSWLWFPITAVTTPTGPSACSLVAADETSS